MARRKVYRDGKIDEQFWERKTGEWWLEEQQVKLRGCEQFESVKDGITVVGIAKSEVGLGCGRKSNDVRICMLAWEGIVSVGEWIKEVAIEKVLHGEIVKTRTAR